MGTTVDDSSTGQEKMEILKLSSWKNNTPAFASKPYDQLTAAQQYDVNQEYEAVKEALKAKPSLGKIGV